MTVSPAKRLSQSKRRLGTGSCVVVLDGGPDSLREGKIWRRKAGRLIVKYSDCLLSTMQCRYVCLEMFVSKLNRQLRYENAIF